MIKTMHYEISGEGEKTLVMLHGWGVDGKYFSQVEKQFNTKAKCLIVDFYGFGKTSEPPDYFDTYEYAYQLFLLLKKLGVGKIVLVGHSFGGRVAIILSSIFDIDICGLVLTSSAGLNRFSFARYIKVQRYKFLKRLSKYGIVCKEKLTKFGSDDYKKLSENLKAVFKKIVRQDLGYLLHKISVPTKMYWAKDDRETPYWMCKKLNKKIKNSSAVVAKNGGHFVYIKRGYGFKRELDGIIDLAY